MNDSKPDRQFLCYSQIQIKDSLKTDEPPVCASRADMNGSTRRFRDAASKISGRAASTLVIIQHLKLANQLTMAEPLHR